MDNQRVNLFAAAPIHFKLNARTGLFRRRVGRAPGGLAGLPARFELHHCVAPPCFSFHAFTAASVFAT
jgi:hypothetical protein